MLGKAKKIVEAILDDLTGRAGMGNAWEDCDEDIQAEIREEWVARIMDILEAPVTLTPCPLQDEDTWACTYGCGNPHLCRGRHIGPMRPHQHGHASFQCLHAQEGYDRVRRYLKEKGTIQRDLRTKIGDMTDQVTQLEADIKEAKHRVARLEALAQ